MAMKMALKSMKAMKMAMAKKKMASGMKRKMAMVEKQFFEIVLKPTTQSII